MDEKVKICEDNVTTLTFTNDKLTEEMAALREELKTAQDRLLKMSKEEEDSIEKVLGIKVCTSKEEFYKNSQIGILKWVSFKFQSKASPVDNSIV